MHVLGVALVALGALGPAECFAPTPLSGFVRRARLAHNFARYDVTWILRGMMLPGSKEVT